MSFVETKAATRRPVQPLAAGSTCVPRGAMRVPDSGTLIALCSPVGASHLIDGQFLMCCHDSQQLAALYPAIVCSDVTRRAKLNQIFANVTPTHSHAENVVWINRGIRAAALAGMTAYSLYGLAVLYALVLWKHHVTIFPALFLYRRLDRCTPLGRPRIRVRRSRADTKARHRPRCKAMRSPLQ